MAMKGPDSSVTISMDEDRQSATSILEWLRTAWTDYVSESKQGWSKLVEVQAKEPSLD